MRVRIRSILTAALPVAPVLWIAMAASALIPSPALATVHPVALFFDRIRHTGVANPTAELHCLALNIYHEARSEKDQGKRAVAEVTLNRVRSAKFPNSICRVVWQRGQFSWTRDGKSDRPYERDAWQSALRIANLAFWGRPSSRVGHATHYHLVGVWPSWARSKTPVARIGLHYFYRL